MKVVRALDKKNHLKIYFSLCGKREERGESGDIQTINKIIMGRQGGKKGHGDKSSSSLQSRKKDGRGRGRVGQIFEVRVLGQIGGKEQI